MDFDKKEYHKQYREKNKEKNKQYRENNKEKLKEYGKEYRKKDNYKKTNRIGLWKYRGVINDDFDSLYEYYLNCKNCENCDIELINGRSFNGRCLDHDHSTGLFRNVLCRSCNIKRG